MPDEPQPLPAPEPPPSPELLKARRALQQLREGRAKSPDKMSVSDIVLGTAVVTTITGVILAIVIPGLCSGTRGARYSVRIEWERRNAELDAAAEQARKDGKLPPLPESKSHE